MTTRITIKNIYAERSRGKIYFSLLFEEGLVNGRN
jgi:hypothetical protein